MLITSCVWCLPFLRSLCRPPLLVLLSFCISECRPQHNSWEIKDRTTRLPDPACEGFWNNVRGTLRSMSQELQPHTQHSWDLRKGGFRAGTSRNKECLPDWGGIPSRMGVALQGLVSVPFREGRWGVTAWWESSGGPELLEGFALRILPKDTLPAAG